MTGRHAPCPALVLDSQGLVIAADIGLCRLVGRPAEDIEGRPFDTLLTGASRVLYQSYLQPLLRMHGNVEEISLSIKTEQGPPVDVLFYSSRHTQADGSEALDVVLAPIRRRRGIEAEMLRIKRAADQAPGLIFQLVQMPGGEQHFPFVSQAVRRLYGISPEEAHAASETVLGRIVAADRTAMAEGMAQAAAQGRDWTGAFRVLLDDGVTHWHEMHCTPRELASGVLVWHGHIADITARRSMESDLAERAANDRMTAMRSEFLARVSHELRTPLNGIIGFTQLLVNERADPLSHTQRERLGVITASGQHLLQLVNQVLDITSLEATQPRVDLQALALEPAIGAALDLVQPLAAAAGVDLQLEPAAGGLWVVADALRLRQVLVNLLSNAIKYNFPGGQVRVRAERMANEVRVDISDTGSGLTPLQQAELFQPFNRLGAQNTKAEGSGLGLVITRHLLALMGGSVSVQSLAGQGSTFSFVLPAQGLASPQTADAEPVALLPEAAPGVATQMPSMARGNVLCVEDNAVNAVLMEAIIEMRPAITLLMVRDGASALAALAGFDPDLLLLDMHLPDTTGTQLLAAMRQQEPGCRAPAVVVSAAARGEDIQRALNAGFAGYWTKPLDIDRTLAELDRLLGG